MTTSPITTWEGAQAVFTFGPGSLGVWLFLALAVAIVIGVAARMIQHENHTFRELSP
ncbi:hypothetical protein SAHL_15495, partial [Salinisphaera orenii YIM 95161]